MPELYLYEYAIVRLVPRVERSEYINVGLVMLSIRQAWLRMEYCIKPELLAAFSPQVTIEEIKDSLSSFQAIAHGQDDISPIAKLDVAERFRWLTAYRSTMIQTSRPHAGKTDDLNATFDKLFSQMVR
jgi:hypothetical protein